MTVFWTLLALGAIGAFVLFVAWLVYITLQRMFRS